MIVLSPLKNNNLFTFQAKTSFSSAIFKIFHIRSISKERLVKKLGEISVQQLTELKEGLNDILRY
ncbi:MAG: type II toxin-antitoxin system PemK/MazF family toxin [Draconibacterium sp.]